MVRCQDGRTGRQALADDTKRAIKMDMCLEELKRHLELHSDRYYMYPQVKSAVRDCVEQMRRKSGPMNIEEMAYIAEEE